MHNPGPTVAVGPYRRGAEADDEEPAAGGRNAAGALPPASPPGGAVELPAQAAANG